jgi:hypothetical protein
MVVEVSYVEMTPDGLLRHVVYLGEREGKSAIDVRREDRPELRRQALKLDYESAHQASKVSVVIVPR